MTLRLIQVGMGGWGRSWNKHIVRNNSNIELVACVDMVEPIRALAQKDLELPEEMFFATLEEAIEKVECDAVLITANLPGHVPVAISALQAGKHVLLEKPFAPSLEEARKVIEIAEQQQRILMISQNYRFHPAARKVIELVREEAFGPVGEVHIDFRRYANTAPREGHVHYTIWQPLLVDMSIHHFDLMRAVLGQEPVSISCHTWNPEWSNFVEPAAGSATITFDRGTVVSYRGSWVSTGPQTGWDGEWRMVCEKGEIIWSGRDDTTPDYVLVRPLGSKQAEKLELPKVKELDRAGSLQAFVEAVESDKEPETTGRDNYNTLSLMLAAVESSLHDGSLTKPLRYVTSK